MKCQILFSRKNITYLSPAELAQRVVKVKMQVFPYFCPENRQQNVKFYSFKVRKRSHICCVVLTQTPTTADDILNYYSSCVFPIQTSHRPKGDIFYYHLPG